MRETQRYTHTQHTERGTACIHKGHSTPHTERRDKHNTYTHTKGKDAPHYTTSHSSTMYTKKYTQRG